MKKRNFLQNNWFMISMIVKISPSRIFATLFNSFSGFFSQIFFSIIFLDYIVSALESGKELLETAMFVVAFMGVFLLINLYSAWYNNSYLPLSNQKIGMEMNKMLFNKVSEVDISCFENPKFYDQYTVAIGEANSRAISTLDNVCNIITAIMTASYLIGLMGSLDYVAPLFIIIPVAGTLICNKFSNKYNYDNSMENIPYSRRIDCVNREIFLKKFAKEIRLTKVKNILYKQYNDAVDGLKKNVDKYKLRKCTVNIFRTIICYPLVMQGAWVYIAYKVMVSKTLGAGDFIILANAIVNSTTMIVDLINNVNTSMASSLYINNLRDFFDYKPKIDEKQPGLKAPEHFDLTFKNVSFTYPGQDAPVLKNLSFSIPSFNKVALVGHNGAGKTTIAKLIMRLYDPTEGEILLNGRNIKEYDVKEYRRMFGTVFQDYQIFAMSVNENVLLDKCGDDMEYNSKKELCKVALEKSGAWDKISCLPDKGDSVLLREFDGNGVILSGGEFQKVAVARVFAKENRIMILDEPSSALDPIAEHAMYDTLAKSYTEGNQKTVIIISHRLSSAVDADMILMLENGELVEQGSHIQLMEMRDKYYNLFEHQARNYV